MLSQKEKTQIVNDCIKGLTDKPAWSVPPDLLAKILSDLSFLIIKDPYLFKKRLQERELKYQRWFWFDMWHRAAIVLMHNSEDALLARIILSDLILGEQELLKFFRLDLKDDLKNIDQNETNQTI